MRSLFLFLMGAALGVFAYRYWQQEGRFRLEFREAQARSQELLESVQARGEQAGRKAVEQGTKVVAEEIADAERAKSQLQRENAWPAEG